MWHRIEFTEREVQATIAVVRADDEEQAAFSRWSEALDRHSPNEGVLKSEWEEIRVDRFRLRDERSEVIPDADRQGACEYYVRKVMRQMVDGI